MQWVRNVHAPCCREAHNFPTSPRSGEGPTRSLKSKARIVRISHQAALSLDRYIRVRARHAQAYRPQLWLGVNNRGPMTANGIYQMIVRRGRQCGIAVYPHRFRHQFSHTWLDRGGAEGDLMELNGWNLAANAAPLRRQRPQHTSPPQLRPHHGLQPLTRETVSP